jgi:glycosyltransferase involved in cell wall biosynthesis
MPGLLRSLYVCYLSLEDPLVETQVVAYLEGLARRGHTIHLLTYEPKLSAERKQRFRANLARRGITWHSLRYHKRPSFPATVFDALFGALVAARLVRRHRLDAIHARSHVPAATGLIVRRLTRCRLIFDIRGLLADEYVDAGRWPRGGLAQRVTERVQGAAIARADGIVVLTERVRNHLFGPGAREAVMVIPCCADLVRLDSNPGGAERTRARLGLDGRSVMVYVGKLTEPYMDREMVDFFAVAHRLDPGLAFLVVTQAPPAGIRSEFMRAGIPDSDYRITRAEPVELGNYLGMADFAISFCRPSFGRIASSPTKVGEYLGAGLPAVSGPGIGDVDEILDGRDVGVILDEFSEPGYERAAKRIRELGADPDGRARCRAVAREVFSLEEVGIPRYDLLYRQLAEPGGRSDQEAPR